MREPIVAIATPLGESAVGLIRLTGSGVLDIAKRFFKTKSDIKPRRVYFGTLYDPSGSVVDEGLLVYFKGPASYTGEDLVEISLHGNPFILRKALETFIHGGCKLAQPGEFTKRAFLNGKMDLTQAEAVADLISAKTNLAHRAAISQLRGEMSKYIKPLRETLIELSAYIEADIEFSEEDIPTLTREQVVNMVDKVLAGIDDLLKTSKAGRFLRHGIKLAIVGKPNVGKSSIFNALLGQDRAIVTDVEGTTRDYLEEALNIKGIPVILVDTAGIRYTADPVEKIGVQKSLEKINEADVVVFVVDASRGLDSDDLRIYDNVSDRDVIVVLNKVDLPVKGIPLEIFRGRSIIKVSALTGQGLEDLETEILRNVGILTYEGLNIYVSIRHEELLRKSRDVLRKFRDLYMEDYVSPEIAMLYVREAADYLGEIVGVISTEDILGSIFSKFCVGK